MSVQNVDVDANSANVTGVHFPEAKTEAATVTVASHGCSPAVQ
jgi:hypothetical protein